MTRVSQDLTRHDLVLLRLDADLADPKSKARDGIGGPVRADWLANSMEGVGGLRASDYAFALQDLKANGMVMPDLGRLHLTEAGEARVRNLKESPASKVVRQIAIDARSAFVAAIVTAPISVAVTLVVLAIT